MFTLPRILAGLVVSVLIVAGAAAAAWWFFIREDAQLATSAPAIPTDLARSPAASTTAGTATTPLAPGTLAFRILSDRSEAAYFAGEKLASLPVPSTAKGATKDIEGVFYLRPDGTLDPAHASTFTVNLKTLKSDKDMRDSRVQNQALQTGQFPTATFVAKSVTGWDTSLPEGTEQDLKLTGTMDLHGVQKDITWDVKARKQGDIITALATVSFLYSDFNIPVLNIAGFVSVEDDVTLQVQVVAQAQTT